MSRSFGFSRPRHPGGGRPRGVGSHPRRTQGRPRCIQGARRSREAPCIQEAACIQLNWGTGFEGQTDARRTSEQSTVAPSFLNEFSCGCRAAFPIQRAVPQQRRAHESLVGGCPVRGCPVHGCPVRGCPVRGCPVRGCPVRADAVRGRAVRTRSVGTCSDQPASRCGVPAHRARRRVAVRRVLGTSGLNPWATPRPCSSFCFLRRRRTAPPSAATFRVATRPPANPAQTSHAAAAFRRPVSRGPVSRSPVSRSPARKSAPAESAAAQSSPVVKRSTTP